MNFHGRNIIFNNIALLISEKHRTGFLKKNPFIFKLVRAAFFFSVIFKQVRAGFFFLDLQTGADKNKNI